jgi:hypothetical protein
MDHRGTVICANPKCRTRIPISMERTGRQGVLNLRAECPLCGTVRRRSDLNVDEVITTLMNWNLVPWRTLPHGRRPAATVGTDPSTAMAEPVAVKRL